MKVRRVNAEVEEKTKGKEGKEGQEEVDEHRRIKKREM